jgi:hypothetical protein
MGADQPCQVTPGLDLGLDLGVILFVILFAKKMDCRVKPGNYVSG